MRNAASADAEVAWQAVEAGNADEGVASNTLSINVPIDSDLVQGLAVGPNPFTPNGDGINDSAEISLEIFKLTSSRRLQVRIYTLDGRRVWQREEMVLSGRTTMRWDGVDDHGRRAPPACICAKSNSTPTPPNSLLPKCVLSPWPTSYCWNA